MDREVHATAGQEAGATPCLTEALGGLVGVDLAVANMHHAMRKFGDVRLVGDQHNGVAVGVQRIEERHDLQAGLGVEVAGGLVGQENLGGVEQRPGDGHALLLAAGQLSRAVVQPGRQAHLVQ